MDIILPMRRSKVPISDPALYRESKSSAMRQVSWLVTANAVLLIPTRNNEHKWHALRLLTVARLPVNYTRFLFNSAFDGNPIALNKTKNKAAKIIQLRICKCANGRMCE